jgi:predicted DNA-binding protein (MmcQ/YjbR family)
MGEDEGVTVTLDQLRSYCLSFQGATEDIKWGADLTFCVGAKMFAITSVGTAYPQWLSLKVTPEAFAEFTQRDGIVPSPYLARYKWISIREFDSLSDKELKELIKMSYKLVYDKLPAKIKKEVATM